MENNLKYFIITLGCQMNKSDSERIAAMLEKRGYQPAAKEADADLIIMNTCSVRQSAMDRVFGLAKNLTEIKKKNPRLKTVLTGCVLPEDFKKTQKMFDYILSIKNLSQWPEYFGQEQFFQAFDMTQKECSYFNQKPKYSNSYSVFIPISSGCSNFCSYCAVPYTRGPLVSRSYKEVMIEVENAINNGAKEIWLLGQNVNDYNDKGINFAKLLKMINELPGNFWIRFTSPHPKDFTSEMIEALARSKKMTPYFNLPMQSGDDEVLLRMKRLYKIGEYKSLVKRIRAAFSSQRQGLEKELALSTDIITGYPGETRDQYVSTLKAMEEVGYDMAYIAKYSPRPGTVSSWLPDNVSQKEKDTRWKYLTQLLEKTALAKNKKFLGETIEVLIDEQRKDVILGKSRHFKTVKIRLPKDNSENFTGQFVKAKITAALAWGLEGDLA